MLSAEPLVLKPGRPPARRPLGLAQSPSAPFASPLSTLPRSNLAKERPRGRRQLSPRLPGISSEFQPGQFSPPFLTPLPFGVLDCCSPAERFGGKKNKGGFLTRTPSAKEREARGQRACSMGTLGALRAGKQAEGLGRRPPARCPGGVGQSLVRLLRKESGKL